MRFSTTFLAIAILALSSSSSSWTVSAQTTPIDPAKQAACNQCLTAAAEAQVPACKGLDAINNPLIAALSETEKQCLCGLAGNHGWIATCDAKCPSDSTNVAQVNQFYLMMNIQVCTGFTPVGTNGTASNSTAGSKNASPASFSSSSIMAVGATAVAAAVAAFAL
ncbi:hypothetical protein BGX29_008439 [Mortierella sp. GBA35]|nr:hypothetical protein BGX23_011283 [Mortierella sp. AD031]KAF9096750.1 hypothetical protein BGX29_008439 [Mortierella sp. GBA35]